MREIHLLYRRILCIEESSLYAIKTSIVNMVVREVDDHVLVNTLQKIFKPFSELEGEFIM